MLAMFHESSDIMSTYLIHRRLFKSPQQRRLQSSGLGRRREWKSGIVVTMGQPSTLSERLKTKPITAFATGRQTLS